MKPEQRKELGKMGRTHVQKNYNFEKYCEGWVKIMTDVYEKWGSWEDRKNYNSWELVELT